MSATSAPSTAAAERVAAHKLTQSKSNAQAVSLPGQFAALMLLQANQDPMPHVADAKALPAEKEAEVARPKADDEPRSVDAPQMALQALLDWRGLSANAPPCPPHAAPVKTDSAPAGQPPQQNDVPLVETTVTFAKESLAKTFPGRPPDSSTSVQKSVQNPDSVDNLLGNAFGWAAQSPNNIEGEARLAKAPEPSLSANTVHTQQAAVNAGWTDTNAFHPLSKARPSSTKDSTTRPTGMTMAETTTSTQPPHPQPRKTAELAAQIRSTLEFADRGEPSENPVKNSTQQVNASEPTEMKGSSGPEAPAADGIQNPLTQSSSAASDNASLTESFVDTLQQHTDDIGPQISYWTAQGAQRASFTIGSTEDGHLEVKLSFTDGQLAITFETDEEGVREVLRDGAQEALQKLMDIQGIVLGQVSVGGGQTDTPNDPSTERPTVELAQRGRAQKAVSPEGSASATPRIPDIMTANKLDFYA